MDESAPKGESIATWIVDQWGRGDLVLARERRDYWLNLAFIEGEQWVYWHPTSRTVAEFPRPNVDRVRLTMNRMQPNLINLLAKLTKRTLQFEVPASDADDAALGGARLAEHLLEASRNDCQWEHVRLDALNAAFLGGTSAVCVEWDPNSGDQLGVDEETDQPVNEGNVQLSALSMPEFTLEPGTRTWQDARWFIMCKVMPPGQVREHYSLDVMPEGDAQAGTGPLQRQLWADRGYAANVDLTMVFTYYERPTGKNKQGRWVVVVNGKPVLDKPWPFPFDTLNIYPFRQIRIPKRWTGHTLLNDARGIQVAYNHARSMLAEHMKLAGNARLAIPDGSGVDATDLSDLPGEIINYDGMSGAPPQWLNPPNIPRWLIDQANQLRSELDDVMTVHDISRGVAPGDRNSGLALSVLAEKDETPMGLMAHDQSEGWGYIGSLTLKLWEAKVPEYRSTTVQADSQLPLSQEWTGKMLHGQTRVVVPLENVMPQSRAATQAWILNIAQQFPQALQGLAGSPAKLAKLLDMPGAGSFGEMADADAAQAQRENMLMEAGQIPSLGDKPFPMPFDDHAVHIAEHNRFRKTKAYMYAPARTQQIFDHHVLAHENLALKDMQGQVKMNAALPGSGGLPQANEPPGSQVPSDHAEQAASQLQAAGQQAAPMGAG